MDIDAAQGRDVQDPLGQELSIGHGDDQIRRKAPKLLHHGVVPEGGGLKDRQTVRLGQELDLGGDQLHAPVLGGVGLGVDADDLMLRLQDGGKAGRGKGRCSHEDKLHSSSSRFCFMSASYSSSVSIR